MAGVFLWIIGPLNLVVLIDLWTVSRRARTGGHTYTVEGIGAMFRRCVIMAGIVTMDAAGKKHVTLACAIYARRARPICVPRRGGYPHDPAAARPQERATTEIYLKQLLTEIVRPNEVPIVASVK